MKAVIIPENIIRACDITRDTYGTDALLSACIEALDGPADYDPDDDREPWPSRDALKLVIGPEIADSVFEIEEPEEEDEDERDTRIADIIEACLDYGYRGELLPLTNAIKEILRA